MAREASGITDSALDRIVEGSSTIGGNTLHIPHAESIVEHLFEELRLMLPPLEVAGRAHPDVQVRFEIYRRRLDDLVAHAPLCHEDQLIVGAIAMLTRAIRERPRHGASAGDRPARRARCVSQANVVGRDHRRRTRLRRSRPADRPLVRAFMKGVNDNGVAQIRSPRPRHHRHARWEPALHPERSRLDRRARDRHHRHRAVGDGDLHRRPSAADRVPAGHAAAVPGRNGRPLRSPGEDYDMSIGRCAADRRPTISNAI